MVSRTGLFEMPAADDRGEFAIILVEDLNRLSRSAPYMYSLQDELKSRDVDVHAFYVGVTREAVS